MKKFDSNWIKSLISGRLKKTRTNAGGAKKKRKERYDPEQTKQRGVKAKKGRKAKTKTWSNVVKGLKKIEELETTNSDKSGNGSETTDSAEQFDSDKPNRSKAKRSVRQPMPTSK